MAGFGMINTSIIFLFCIGAVLAQPNRNQVENFANLAEKMSDRQHVKYCERFGDIFKTDAANVWPKIHEQCIEKMVKDGEQLPKNFPKIDGEMRKKLVAIFEVCAPPVKNPCIPEEWTQIKKCIRDQALNNKLFEVNGHQALPKNVPSISLGLATAVLVS